MITNTESSTNVAEIADGIFRINTPLDVVPGGFSFNQYLIVDEKPFLFHTGLRKMFPLISEAIRKVIPLEKLRYIGFSHFESDECGALNDFLAVAESAEPVCSRIAAMTSVNDFAERPPKALADGDQLTLGKHTLRWFDTPHLPHGWESGLMFDEYTETLFCGDLFTQPGLGTEPVTESDILGPSEMLREKMQYFSASKNTDGMLQRLADTRPKTLAVMHGSAWRGDGAALIGELSKVLSI